MKRGRRSHVDEGREGSGHGNPGALGDKADPELIIVCEPVADGEEHLLAVPARRHWKQRTPASREGRRSLVPQE
jgi:hypothetical protein